MTFVLHSNRTPTQSTMASERRGPPDDVAPHVQRLPQPSKGDFVPGQGRRSSMRACSCSHGHRRGNIAARKTYDRASKPFSLSA
jgi:hypothetical protein